MDKIRNHLNNQKSVLNLNNIPTALQRIKETLSSIDDPSKIERITRGVHNLKAMKCSLLNIDIISRFTHLTDLNISDNRELKSLKGIE